MDRKAFSKPLTIYLLYVELEKITVFTVEFYSVISLYYMFSIFIFQKLR